RLRVRPPSKHLAVPSRACPKIRTAHMRINSFNRHGPSSANSLDTVSLDACHSFYWACKQGDEVPARLCYRSSTTSVAKFSGKVAFQLSNPLASFVAIYLPKQRT